MLALHCCQFLGSRTAYVLKALQDGASGPDRVTVVDYALTVHVNLLHWQSKIQTFEFKLKDKKVWLNFWTSLVCDVDAALAKEDVGSVTKNEDDAVKAIVEQCMNKGLLEQGKVDGGGTVEAVADDEAKDTALFLVLFLCLSRFSLFTSAFGKSSSRNTAA